MKKTERILIVGSLNVVFIHSYAISFLERGFEVLVLDIGVDKVEHSYLTDLGIRVVRWSKAPSGGFNLKRRAKKFAKRFGVDRSDFFIGLLDRGQAMSFSSPRLNSDCRDVVVSFSPTHIMYGWSTTVRMYKFVLDDLISKNVSSSLIVNTYPVRENFTFENPGIMTDADVSFFSGFDVVMQTSEPMTQLFVEMGYENINCLTHDDRLHPSFFSEIEGCSKRSMESRRRVVFLGNTNFDERTIDDVRSDLVRMLDSEIEVAIQRPKSAISIDSRFTFFDPFTYEEIARGELAKFIGTFDFVYMGYNDLMNARTCVSFPTRFALAMTGNIPILLERQNWAGIKAAVGDVAQICEFDDIDDCLEVIRLHQHAPKGVSNSAYGAIFDQKMKVLIEKLGLGQ